MCVHSLQDSLAEEAPDRRQPEKDGRLHVIDDLNGMKERQNGEFEEQSHR